MIENLNKLKDFLADRPEWAFLAISLTVNAYLFRLLLKAKDAHFATVERWLPVAERLASLVQMAASKARRTRPVSLVKPPEGGS